MTDFHLKIVTPVGVCYDALAQSVTVNTITGYVGILAGHIDMTTSLATGEARILIDGQLRKAYCSKGLLSVQKGELTLLPTVFRWNE